MADTPVRSAGPVNAAGGFAGRAPGQAPSKAATPTSSPSPTMAPRAADRVCVVHGATVALRLLRERVLARTRTLLELGEDSVGPGPEFAEILDGEPVPVFVGRLLSAQNLLASRRAGSWLLPRIRHTLDQAMRSGAAETLGLFTAKCADDAVAVAVIDEVLTEYERRLGSLSAATAAADVPRS